jgi:hypothetical protein
VGIVRLLSSLFWGFKLQKAPGRRRSFEPPRPAKEIIKALAAAFVKPKMPRFFLVKAAALCKDGNRPQRGLILKKIHQAVAQMLHFTTKRRDILSARPARDD